MSKKEERNLKSSTRDLREGEKTHFYGDEEINSTFNLRAV